MEMVFAIGISILSLALVVLITLQPRQQQSLSTDATSNLGKAKLLALPPWTQAKRPSLLVSSFSYPYFFI